jgi:hypothetical protein
VTSTSKALTVTAYSAGQEGQGLAARVCTLPGVLPGEEGQNWMHLRGTSPSMALVTDHHEHPAGQEGQGLLRLGEASHNYSTPDATQPDLLLFKPGVLEALSGAVAARLATANANDASTFIFNAKKNPMQVQPNRKSKKGKKRRERLRTQRTHAGKL